MSTLVAFVLTCAMSFSACLCFVSSCFWFVLCRRLDLASAWRREHYYVPGSFLLAGIQKVWGVSGVYLNSPGFFEIGIFDTLRTIIIGIFLYLLFSISL